MRFRITARRAVPLASLVAATGLIVPAAIVGVTPSSPATIDDASFAPVVLGAAQADAVARTFGERLTPAELTIPVESQAAGEVASRVPSTEHRDDTLAAEPTEAPIAARVAPKGRAAVDMIVKPAPKPKPKPVVAAAGGGSVRASGVRARIVQVALAQLHDRYVRGGTGPDAFDCSGLVRYAYNAAGVGGRLGGGHSASAMYQWGLSHGLTSRSNGRPGDVVIYGGGSHAGIYLGNGRIVSALNPSQGIRITGLHALGAPFTAFIHTRI